MRQMRADIEKDENVSFLVFFFHCVSSKTFQPLTPSHNIPTPPPPTTTPPQVQLLLQGLRGQALNDDSAAAAGTQMLVVEMEEGQGEDVLPTSYQPERLEAYFAKRPAAVQKRVAQILSISSGFLFQVAVDAARGKVRACVRAWGCGGDRGRVSDRQSTGRV